MSANGSNGQWGWFEMEELFQCPVCFESPTKGVVEQCKSGHHICSECKPKVENCPLCKCSYTGTRNFVVEELMRNLEILKNTMLLTALTAQESTASPKKKKATKEKEIPLVVPKHKINLPSTPAATKGNYPCAIGFCECSVPACRLLNHVRSCHSKYLTEGALNTDGTFKVTFSLFSSNSMHVFKWQRALFVSGIGLVFFTYILLKNGSLIATIQMAAKRTVSQRFKGVIELRNQRGANYTQRMKLISTRDKLENILYREDCLLLSKRQVQTLKQPGKVMCSIELSLVKETDNFGSNYPRISKDQLRDILLFYNTHNGNGPSSSAYYVDVAF